MTNTPEILGLLSQAIDEWPEFDRDDEVSGADLVDWFGQWRARAKTLLKHDIADQAGERHDSEIRDHLSRGFVVLTHNPANEPHSLFEAWAYDGPLDFDQAASVCFGLGPDPAAALDALNWHLQRMAGESID